MNGIRRLLIALNNTRIRCLLAAKIKKISRGVFKKDPGIPKLASELRERHQELWKDYRRRINYDWLEVYTAISGRHDYRYVPEDIYYTEIEPRLNNKLFSKAWTDKNSYDLFLGERVKIPEVILRCINGVLYTPDFRPAGRPGEFTAFPPAFEGKKLVIKPTMDSGGGKAVSVITCSGEGIEMNPHVQGVTTVSRLFGLYGGNFIIQKYIDQHPWFSRFNESSLNTVRVLTYRSIKDEEPVVLHRSAESRTSGVGG